MEPENNEIIADMMFKAREHRETYLREKAYSDAIIIEARNIAKKYGITQPEHL